MMNTNPQSHRSQRNIVFANPLEAEAGLEILKKGGNAIDAVEPNANDYFVLVWVKDKLYALNSSGFAPETITLEYYQKKEFKKMPIYGFDAVTVPSGHIVGW